VESILTPGAKVLHRFNQDLGPGEVVDLAAGRVRVRFPRSGRTLEFSVRDHAFTPLSIPEGTDPEKWFEDYREDMIERLARIEVDDLAAWDNRIESLRLSRIREADGLGSFLGGRIEIFPHQIHVAEQAVATDPVRWLLADEVGLGKTVEACLIASRLVRTRRAESALIIAPSSLTVQWLGELYRKFHQVFVLLDRDRIKDVRRDFGPEFNPFHAHPRSVVALEDLIRDNQLAREAREADLELLVVDEAHRLERRPGHPGTPAYRTLAPLCGGVPNVLLLSATPLEADAHGFFRLLQLLRPEEYSSWERFQADLEAGVPLYPCTSATRREDIGGLPPRVPERVDIESWPELEEAVAASTAEPAQDALQKRRRADALLRVLEDPTGDDDPRLRWILERVRDWKKAGEKILVFVNRKESLDVLKAAIERATLDRVGVFHEELTPAARDMEVAQFALPEGPTVMISTEAGGEGRNFEFCLGLVLFDLPWNPVLVEQRIGRLDRISRKRPVEIVYFRPPSGFARDVVELYEALGMFREPLGGLDRSLANVESAIREAAAGDAVRLDIRAIVRETREARRLVNRGIYHNLHQKRFRAELTDGIVARIPEDLESRTADVVLEACAQFGFDAVEKQGVSTWYLEFGNHAVIDHLPGVQGETRWLGTFDRAEAVTRETIEFFASGHPLVEGVLMELEDGHRGEVALLDVPGTGMTEAGLLAVVKRGPEFSFLVHDFEGRPQPDWARFFETEEAGWERGGPAAWGLGTSREFREAWGERVRTVLQPAQKIGKLVGVAAFRLLP
jgi:ATP-dependent helicase HepA